MNWIFKKVDNFQSDLTNQKLVVTYIQRRNFTGQKGENVLLLEKLKGEWKFTTYYRISSISIKILEEEYKQIEITLFLIIKFEDEKLLEEYVYSLRRVTNYAYPIRHFSRKYSRLFDAEFEAIVEDKIYVKRTILGTVLNAMHTNHQKAFISFLALEAPELLTGRADMDKALKLLIAYLDFAVVKPAQYLNDSAEMLKSIVGESDYKTIGFSLEAEIISSRNIQTIKPQVIIINKYLNDLPGYNIEKQGLQFPPVEDNPKFKRLFRNSPLPLTLN